MKLGRVVIHSQSRIGYMAETDLSGYLTASVPRRSGFMSVGVLLLTSARRLPLPLISRAAAAGILIFLMMSGFIAARPRGSDVWDFGLFLLSGYEANRGISPYGDQLLSAYASHSGATLTAPYINPPLVVLAFQPLAELNPLHAFRTWWIVSLALYACCASWLLYAGPGDKILRGLWSLSLAGLWMTEALGQIYVPLLLLAIVAYRYMGRRDLISGFCIGLLVAVKPNFLLWPLFLFISGNTVLACTALLVFAGAWVLPALTFGPQIYYDWLTAITSYHATQLPTNASVALWLSAFLSPVIAWGLGAIAIFGFGAYVTNRRASSLFCSDLALVLVLAVSSVSWVGYMLLTLPTFLRRRWTLPITLSAVLFVIPANVLFHRWSSHPGETFGPRMAYPLAVLLLLVGLIRQGQAENSIADIPRVAVPRAM